MTESIDPEKTRIEFVFILLVYIKKEEKNGKLSEKISTCHSFLFLHLKIEKKRKELVGFVFLD